MVSLLIAPAALGLTLSMGAAYGGSASGAGRTSRPSTTCCSRRSAGCGWSSRSVMEEHEKGRFHHSAAALFRSNMRAARILFMNSPLMELLASFPSSRCCTYAHHRIEAGTLTCGLFGAPCFPCSVCTTPIRKLSRMHIPVPSRAFASASRIMEVFDTHVEIQDRPRRPRIRRAPGVGSNSGTCISSTATRAAAPGVARHQP